jgi:hypothetical protein
LADLRLIWVQDHLLDRVPIACVAAPALGVARARLFVNCLSTLKDFYIAPAVAIVGRDKPNCTVLVFGVGVWCCTSGRTPYSSDSTSVDRLTGAEVPIRWHEKPVI